MKKLLLALPLFALTACGYSVFDAAEDVKEVATSGMKDGKKIGKEAAETGNFTKLAAVGPDNIIFETGAKFTIRASGDDEAVDDLRYKLEGGKLVIGRASSGWSGSDGDATIYVTAPTLSSVSLAGSGDFSTNGIEGDEFKVSMAGSGNADMKAVKVKKFTGSLAGAGDLQLAGETTEAKYSLAGSGDINATQLKAAQAKASIAGSGDIDLFATETVKASIAGSGDIDVTGGAKCDSSVVGSGDVNCAS